VGSTNTHLWVQVPKLVPIIGDSSSVREQNLLEVQTVPRSASVGIALASGTHWCTAASLGAGGVPSLLPDTSRDATGQWCSLCLGFNGG
jgi:hypothetical protein